jgi:hypothetical protein
LAVRLPGLVLKYKEWRLDLIILVRLYKESHCAGTWLVLVRLAVLVRAGTIGCTTARASTKVQGMALGSHCAGTWLVLVLLAIH